MERAVKPLFRVTVTSVRGSCIAALEAGDSFLLDGLRFIPQGHDKVCSYAFASLIASLGRLKFTHTPLYAVAMILTLVGGVSCLS